MNNETQSAFPFTPTDRSGQIGECEPGLTKRELFAAMAMQGLCANTVLCTENIPAGAVAGWSVEQADALLAALAVDRNEHHQS